MRMQSAIRHLRAHLTSTVRILETICCFSAEVFSGNHAAGSEDEDEGSGARNGVKRMRAPIIQKGGNTVKEMVRFNAIR